MGVVGVVGAANTAKGIRLVGTICRGAAARILIEIIQLIQLDTKL